MSYRDLINAVVGGSAYASSGYVLPYRDAPQEFVFEDTSAPSAVYGVFVNGQFRGTVTADVAGRAVVRERLDRGRASIVIENDQTGARLTSEVTVRDYAVWHAAYGDALDEQAARLESVKLAPGLGTADAIHIEDVHGRLLEQPNDLGYTLNAYRNTLFALREVARRAPSQEAGLAQVAAAYTDSLGLVVPRAWNPDWVLGAQRAPLLTQRTHVVQGVLPNLNVETVSAVSTVASTASTGAVTQPPSPQRLRVVYESSWGGGTITVTGTDAAGVVVSESFPVASATTVGSFDTVEGAEFFATVTAVTNSSTSAGGSAYVGLTNASYISVVEVRGTPVQEGLSSAGAAYLALENNAGQLSLSFGPSASGGNDNRVDVVGSGRYEVPYRARGGRLITTDASSWDFSNGAGERGADRLYLNVSGRGDVVVPLGGTGGLTGGTAADVVSDIDSVLTPDTRYGSGGSFATVVSSTSGVTASSVLLDSTAFPAAGATLRGSISLGLRCCDASRQLFNIPYYVGDAASGASAGATSLNYSAGDTIGDVTAPFTARVGRGQLDAGGSGVVSAVGGRFATFTFPTAVEMRVGECVRIEGSGGNAGLHTVAVVASSTAVTLRHESPTGSFSVATGEDWQAWILGDLVEVSDVNTGTETITCSALPRALPSGFQVELASEMPYSTDSTRLEAPATLVVDVDAANAPALASGSTLVDELGLAGALIPDGWRLVSGASVQVKPDGAMSIQRGSTDISLQTEVEPVLGFPFTATFSLQAHNDTTEEVRIDVSFDGSTFSTGSAIEITGTIEIDGSSRRSNEAYQQAVRQFVVPHDATTLIVRLVHVGGTAGDRITVLRGVVTGDYNDSYFLARGTVVRNTDRQAFRELLYYWSPEDLAALDDAAVQEHVRLLSAAHSRVDAIDVTEYASGTPLNLVGAYSAAQWNAATLTNMNLVVEAPARLSHVRPTRLSRVEDEELSVSSGGTATLAVTSSHVGTFPQNPDGSIILLQDGVPVPDTTDAASVQPYVMSAANEVDLAPSYTSSSSTYVASYNARIMATTAVLNLGSNFADYLWLVDAWAWTGAEQSVSTRTVRQGLSPRADGTALLDTRADIERPASLIADDGIRAREVPRAEWRFVSANEVRINGLDNEALYTLTYASRVPAYSPSVDVVIEHRAAGTQAAVPAASWTAVEVDQLVDNGLQFHQLRCRLGNVRSLDDVRVHGLGLRGIELFGSTPNAPGIILT